MSEEKLSRRDFLAGIGATLGLAAVGVIAATPMTAVAAKPSGLPATAACSRCHVSAPCDDDCATCPENANATLADK